MTSTVRCSPRPPRPMMPLAVLLLLLILVTCANVPLVLVELFHR